jgi:hypothetical protein
MKIDMTQDEIIEMAKQANAIPIHKDFNQLALIGTENIERFAKLVAQHEREACAKLAENTKAPFTATVILSRGQA